MRWNAGMLQKLEKAMTGIFPEASRRNVERPTPQLLRISTKSKEPCQCKPSKDGNLQQQ